MSEQTKTSQAENSLDAAQHAVDQAESHPSGEKIEEADNSLEHAEIAVRQAADSGSSEAGELAGQLESERSVLESE
ncbi:MAG: hypothetical protein JWR03_2768 [Cohnella sp.]|nr:hypothetical protein [Cohnella sp.]